MAKRSETMRANRTRLVSAARKHFARNGYSAASMDEITADAGLTRGALYSNFGDKRGLLAAVVDQIDTEMAVRARERAADTEDGWQRLLTEASAYIEMALEPEVQRIVLLDGRPYWAIPRNGPAKTAVCK